MCVCVCVCLMGVLHVNTRQLRSAPILRSCTSCPSLPVLISCRVSDLRGPRVHQAVEAPLPLPAWRAGRSMPAAQRTSCLGMLLHNYMSHVFGKILSCDGQHVCYDFMLTFTVRSFILASGNISMLASKLSGLSHQRGHPSKHLRPAQDVRLHAKV